MLRDPTFRRVDASQDFRPQTMTYDLDKHHRRSIRLKNYDYGQPGTYYVTICTARRRCLFGRIENEKMHSSPSGEIVQEEWLRSAEMRSRVALDAFVIMPIHLHGIILLSDFDGASESVAAAETRRVTLQRHPTPDDEAPQRDAAFEQFGNPHPTPFRPSFACSNPPPRNGSTSAVGRRDRRSGNAIITSTSSGIKRTSTGFGNTLPRISRDGMTTSKTHEIDDEPAHGHAACPIKGACNAPRRDFFVRTRCHVPYPRMMAGHRNLFGLPSQRETLMQFSEETQ